MTRARSVIPGAVAGLRPPAPAAARRFGVRTALVAGFSLVVALWLIAVINLAYRVREADRQLDAMTEQFIQTEDALQTLRASVLLAAIDWRDAFLDTDPDQIAYYRSLLVGHQNECARLLAALRSSEDEWISRDALNTLDEEVSAYWAGVIPLIEMAPMRQAAQARRVLNERVIPKRSLVVSIVQQVQQLNRSRFQRQQRDTAAVYTRAQSRVAVTGGLATLLSVLVGAVVF
ncbi:MAG: MCP four helix bundle domain-containing protein, partial [Vicinamibacterales bacterium]|nr:MCP four helix bundle domain-containing protein [Vicinamibacterales bacterium]